MVDLELQSEIDRYVIGDPEFDRGVFEERMRDDERLALYVAESVRRLELADAATRQVFREETTTMAGTSSSRWAVIFSVVACVLVMLGVVFRDRNDQVEMSVEQSSLPVVAENWAALGFADSPTEYDETETYVIPNLNNNRAVLDSDAAAYELPLYDDWMLSAAADYFQETEG